MRKALFFLGILDDSDLDWMIANGLREEVSASSVLIREGEQLEALYIVLDGAFSVTVAALNNQEVARLLCGEVMGEMSFVDSRPPSATVTAVEDSWVLSIPRDRLDDRLGEDPGFSARFYRSLSVFLADRLRSTIGRLGYGEEDSMDQDSEYEDELDLDVLDKVGLAGARFDWMLRRLRGN